MKPNILFIDRDWKASFDAKELAKLARKASQLKLSVNEYSTEADCSMMVAKPKKMPDLFRIGKIGKFDIGTFCLDYTLLDLPHTETKNSGGYAPQVSLHWDGEKLWGRVEDNWPAATRALKKAKASAVKEWLLSKGNLGKWVPFEEILKLQEAK